MNVSESKNQPLVSVGMPVYNSKRFLRRAIDTNLQMMRPVDELLIINDGSEDLDLDYLESIKHTDHRIRLISKKHSGLVDTLNIGVSEAQYELIARSDCDDEYSPERLTIQTDFLSNNLEIALVFSDYEIFKLSGQSIGHVPSAVFALQTMISLVNPQRTAHPSAMFRKSVFIDSRGYMSNDFPAEDLGLWARFIENHQIATVPHTLLKYARHQSSITSKKREEVIKKSNAIRVEVVETIFRRIKGMEVDQVLPYYSGVPLESERKVLALRDLHTYSKLRNSRSPNYIWEYLKRTQGVSVMDLVTGARLLKEKIHRRF